MAAAPETEFAPAKINLCLHVTGQRADGYHLLDSIVAFAQVGDRISALRGGAFSLTAEGPFGPKLPPGDDNLVLRAARAYAPDFPLQLVLEKHLPLASGIGGGSADAAAVLRLIARLRETAEGRVEMPDPDLLAALGADVPVCYRGDPARMRGIGDIVQPLPPMPPGWVVLVNPGVELPTPAVFRALATRENPALPDDLPHWSDMAFLARWLAEQRNDLEAPARALAPVIGDVLAALAASDACLLARMSGSGATCFGLYAEGAAAVAAALAITTAQPGWWVAAAPLTR